MPYEEIHEQYEEVSKIHEEFLQLSKTRRDGITRRSRYREGQLYMNATSLSKRCLGEGNRPTASMYTDASCACTVYLNAFRTFVVLSSPTQLSPIAEMVSG